MEMEAAPAPKRASAGGGSAPDRLSALPDELLHRVLSFLPSRQAVQTTVLSKRWIDLWRSGPAIDLNINDFEWRSTDAGHFEEVMWRKMESFTTNLLMRHRAPRLDAFRLHTVSTRVDWRRDVDRWIRRAIEYCPVELHIRLPVARLGAPYQLPKPFSCPLKRLALSGVSLGYIFGEQLRSECPVLEDLELWRCHEFSGLHSDTLKRLDILDCSGGAADKLVIRAPSLASLRLSLYDYDCRNGVLLYTEKFLAEAWIYLGSDQLSRRGKTILLGSLFNVTSLELDGFSAMAILHKEFDKSPVFHNLRTLSLNIYFVSKRDVNNFKALGRLLQKLPNLEKLTLINFWVRPVVGPIEFPILENLRTLLLVDCYLCDNIRLLRHFLQSSPNLEKLTIRLCKVKPVVGPIEFPILENLRTLLLDECDLCDNIRLLRHFLQRSPNLEKLTVRLCKLPEVFPGGKGKARSEKRYCQFQSLVRFKCQKLKSTEIIYKNGSEIQGLVSLFLGISGCAPKNTMSLFGYLAKPLPG